MCCLLLFPITFTHLLSRDAGTRSRGVLAQGIFNVALSSNLSSKLGPHHRDKGTAGMPSVTEEAASHTTLDLDGVAA